MTIQLYYKQKRVKRKYWIRVRLFQTNILKNEYTENGVVIGCDPDRKWFAKITIKTI